MAPSRCPAPPEGDGGEARHTTAELERIKETLSAELFRPERTGEVSSLGVGAQAVNLRLNPGLESLAAAYADRFGSAVRITLGGHPYVPAGCGPAVKPVRCAELVGASPRSAGLSVDITVDTPTITQAATGRARLMVRNAGPARFSVDSGQPIIGHLVLPGTTTAVGSWTGVLSGVGGGPDLAPGESDEVRMLFGASRCDGQPGSALPPGRYGLRAVLAPTVGSGPRILSPEVPVQVVANPGRPV